MSHRPFVARVVLNDTIIVIIVLLAAYPVHRTLQLISVSGGRPVGLLAVLTANWHVTHNLSRQGCPGLNCQFTAQPHVRAAKRSKLLATSLVDRTANRLHPPGAHLRCPLPSSFADHF